MKITEKTLELGGDKPIRMMNAVLENYKRLMLFCERIIAESESAVLRQEWDTLGNQLNKKLEEVFSSDKPTVQ